MSVADVLDGQPYRLILGDCLSVMRGLPDGCVDMVCADPPYGTTACKWDSIIPLESLWAELGRVLKPDGAVVLTASQPFTTTLISSNRDAFRYCWVWDKAQATGHLNSPRMPMKAHEDIVVFGGNVYNPQRVQRTVEEMKRLAYKVDRRPHSTDCYRSSYHVARDRDTGLWKVPTSVIRIAALQHGSGEKKEGGHPTQKPVALMAYLVRTYTNEEDVVLDFCMGSGTTGVACLQTGRRFLGVEIDPAYFAIAQKRLDDAAHATPLFDGCPVLQPSSLFDHIPEDPTP